MHNRETTNDQLAELIRSHIQAVRGEIDTRMIRIEAKQKQHDERFEQLLAGQNQMLERLNTLEGKPLYTTDQ